MPPPKVPKLQNQAAHIITFSNYDSDAHELIHTLGWRNLNDQRAISKSILMYKTLHSYTPECLTSKFIKRNLILYNLRDTESKLPFHFPEQKSINKAVATVVRCCGIAYLIIPSKSILN